MGSIWKVLLTWCECCMMMYYGCFKCCVVLIVLGLLSLLWLWSLFFSRPLFGAVVYQWDETKGKQVYWNCTFLQVAPWCLMVKSLSTFTFCSPIINSNVNICSKLATIFHPQKMPWYPHKKKWPFPKPTKAVQKTSPKNCRHARGNADSCAPCTRVRPCSWQTRPEICCSSSGPTKKGFAVLAADLSLSLCVRWWYGKKSGNSHPSPIIWQMPNPHPVVHLLVI